MPAATKASSLDSTQQKQRKEDDKKGVARLDVATYKEILNLHVEEITRHKLSKKCSEKMQLQMEASQKWNGFWSLAAKQERKKKRRPSTVIASKKRKARKARNEIFTRMNNLTKPVVHLLDNPDLFL